MRDSEVAAQNAFENARHKAFLRRIWSLFSGSPNTLLNYDTVRKHIHAGAPIDRGYEAVPLDRIIGSVDRYRDFDRAFLPRQEHTRSRWERIGKAHFEDVYLPPVDLYKVGDIYFVIDGNHRVSVARELGREFIDARVQECRVRVPIPASTTEADLEVISGKAEFLIRTHLDETRPEILFDCTAPGSFYHLLEHIETHRYLQTAEWKREFTMQEAAAQWADQVYLPVIAAMRETDILHEFPGNTETDLYLWVIEHAYFMRERQGEVTLKQAAIDYAQHFTPRFFRRLWHYLSVHLFGRGHRSGGDTGQ